MPHCLVLSLVDTGNTLVLTDPVIKSREVFISDVTDTYPVSTLRYVSRDQTLIAYVVKSKFFLYSQINQFK